MKKRRFLMIDMYPTSLAYKLLYILKDYFEITLIVLQDKKTSNLLLENYKELGIKIYFFDPNNRKKEIFKLIFRLIIERFKGYKFVLGKSGPNWPTYLIFKIFNSSKKIFFPYDIFLFLWKNQNIRPKVGVMFEKSNLKRADFIIHKGPEDQLNLIKKEEVRKIEGKPIQFIPCFDKWVIPITKNKTKELSLVYIGGCPDKEIIFRIPFANLFKKISDQGINLHIYPIKTVKKQGFDKISRKNIFYHDSLSNKMLNTEISKYHYGLASGAFFDKKIVDDRMLKTTIGNKFFSYLEAGIPIITDDDAKFPVYLIKKYNCGVIVSEKDMPNLRKIIEKQNYSKLLKGVEKAREELRLSKYAKKLLTELTEV